LHLKADATHKMYLKKHNHTAFQPYLSTTLIVRY